TRRGGTPPAPSRPGLRARRLAVRGARLHFAPQPPRPSPPLPLPRRREPARQPRHRVRLAPPPWHSRRTGASVGACAGARALGARRRARAPAAPAHLRRPPPPWAAVAPAETV